MALDGVRSSCLGVEEDHPHVARDIINEEEEIALASTSSRSDGTIEVTVYQLQLLCGTVAYLVREGQPPLLRQHAGVAKLLDVVDVRHPLHHLLSTKLPQGLKVEVPKALMSMPPVVVASSCKAKGLCHLGVEDVEVVARPAHLGEKTATSVPDAKEPVLDLHTRTILI